MAMSVSLGRAVGTAFIPGEGMCTVFATERSGKFTVQADRSGRRYFFGSRDSVPWRRSGRR
jgi:hypothetical protein